MCDQLIFSANLRCVLQEDVGATAREAAKRSMDSQRNLGGMYPSQGLSASDHLPVRARASVQHTHISLKVLCAPLNLQRPCPSGQA